MVEKGSVNDLGSSLELRQHDKPNQRHDQVKVKQPSSQEKGGYMSSQDGQMMLKGSIKSS